MQTEHGTYKDDAPQLVVDPLPRERDRTRPPQKPTEVFGLQSISKAPGPPLEGSGQVSQIVVVATVDRAPASVDVRFAGRDFTLELRSSYALEPKGLEATYTLYPPTRQGLV